MAESGSILYLAFKHIPGGEQAFAAGARSVRSAAAGVDADIKRADAANTHFALSMRGVGAAVGAVGTVLTAGTALYAAYATSVGLAVNAAAEFERGLVGVGKTAGIEGQTLKALGEDIDRLSRQIPTATNELLEIAGAAGSLGVTGADNITKFTRTVALLGSASDLAGEEAANALARILNVTGESADTVDSLASTIVALGNAFSATESQIARHAGEVARATAVYDLGSGVSAAFATVLASFGVQAELSGSAIGRSFRAIENAVKSGGEAMRNLSEASRASAEQIRDAWESSPVEAFELFLQGIRQVIAEGGNVAQTLETVGLSGEEVLKVLPVLAKEYDTLAKAMSIADAEQRNATALEQEAAKSVGTLAAQMTILSNEVQSALRLIGDELAPVVLEIVQNLRQWFEANREVFSSLGSDAAAVLRGTIDLAKTLASTIDFVIAALVGVAVAWATVQALSVGATVVAWAQAFIAATAAMRLSSIALIGVAEVVAALKVQFAALWAVMAANPLLLIATAVGALAAAFFYLHQKQAEAREEHERHVEKLASGRFEIEGFNEELHALSERLEVARAGVRDTGGQFGELKDRIYQLRLVSQDMKEALDLGDPERYREAIAAAEALGISFENIGEAAPFQVIEAALRRAGLELDANEAKWRAYGETVDVIREKLRAQAEERIAQESRLKVSAETQVADARLQLDVAKANFEAVKQFGEGMRSFSEQWDFEHARSEVSALTEKLGAAELGLQGVRDRLHEAQSVVLFAGLRKGIDDLRQGFAKIFEDLERQERAAEQATAEQKKRFDEAAKSIAEESAELRAQIQLLGQNEAARRSGNQELEVERRVRQAAKDLTVAQTAALREQIATQVQLEGQLSGQQQIAELQRQVTAQNAANDALRQGEEAYIDHAAAAEVAEEARKATNDALEENVLTIQVWLALLRAAREEEKYLYKKEQLATQIEQLQKLRDAYSQGSVAIRAAIEIQKIENQVIEESRGLLGKYREEIQRTVRERERLRIETEARANIEQLKEEAEWAERLAGIQRIAFAEEYQYQDAIRAVNTEKEVRIALDQLAAQRLAELSTLKREDITIEGEYERQMAAVTQKYKELGEAAEQSIRNRSNSEATTEFWDREKQKADEAASFIAEQGISAIRKWVETGKLDFQDLWASFLELGIQAIQELIKKQIVLNIAANASGGGNNGIYGPTQDGGNIATAAGGSSSWASSLGPYAIAIGAFLALVDWRESRRDKDFASALDISGQEFGGRFHFAGGPPSTARSGIEDPSGFFQNLKLQILDIVASMGGVLHELPEMSIRISKDGEEFKLLIEDKLIGTFDSMEEALSAGIPRILAAADISGLSENMRAVLHSVTRGATQDIDTLLRRIDLARRADATHQNAAQQFFANLNRQYAAIEAEAKAAGISLRDVEAMRQGEIQAMRDQYEQGLASILGRNQEIQSFLAQREAYEQFREAAEKDALVVHDLRDAVTGLGGVIGGGSGGGGGGGGAIEDVSNLKTTIGDAGKAAADASNAMGRLGNDATVTTDEIDLLALQFAQAAQLLSDKTEVSILQQLAALTDNQEVRQHLATLEHELKIYYLRQEIESLKLLGQITEATYQQYLDWLKEAELAPPGGGGGGGGNSAGVGSGDGGAEQRRGVREEFVAWLGDIELRLAGVSEEALGTVGAIRQLEERLRAASEAGTRSELIERGRLAGLQQIAEDFLAPFREAALEAGETDYETQVRQLEERRQAALESAFALAEALAAASGDGVGVVLGRLQQVVNAGIDAELAALNETGEDAEAARLDAANGLRDLVLQYRQGLGVVSEYQERLADTQLDFGEMRRLLDLAGLSAEEYAAQLAEIDTLQGLAAHQLGVDFVGSLQALGAAVPVEVMLELAQAQWELARVQAIASATALAAAGAFEGMSITLADLIGLIEDADFATSQWGQGLPRPDSGGGTGYYIPGQGGGSTGPNPLDELRAFREELQRQIDEWNGIRIGDAEREAAALAARFDELSARARQLNLSTAELAAAYANAVRTFIDSSLAEYENTGASQVGQDLEALRDHFADLRRAFQELGASAADFLRLQNAEAAAIEDFWDQALSPWEQGQETIQDRLLAINEQFDEMAAAAEAYGGDLARIEAARLQALQDFWDEALAPLRDYAESLQASEFSGLTPEQRLQQAQSTFDDLAQRALSGDLDAIQQLPQAIDALLGQAQSYYGTGPAYQALFGRIQDLLAAVMAQAPGIPGGGGPGIPPRGVNDDLGLASDYIRRQGADFASAINSRSYEYRLASASASDQPLPLPGRPTAPVLPPPSLDSTGGRPSRLEDGMARLVAKLETQVADSGDLKRKLAETQSKTDSLTSRVESLTDQVQELVSMNRRLLSLLEERSHV